MCTDLNIPLPTYPEPGEEIILLLGRREQKRGNRAPLAASCFGILEVRRLGLGEALMSFVPKVGAFLAYQPACIKELQASFFPSIPFEKPKHLTACPAEYPRRPSIMTRSHTKSGKDVWWGEGWRGLRMASC